jgi:hypothetical protein
MCALKHVQQREQFVYVVPGWVLLGLGVKQHDLHLAAHSGCNLLMRGHPSPQIGLRAKMMKGMAKMQITAMMSMNQWCSFMVSSCGW